MQRGTEYEDIWSDGNLLAKVRPEIHFPSQPLEGTNAANTLISDFQSLDYEIIHFCYLSHIVCGTMLWHPKKINLVI